MSLLIIVAFMVVAAASLIGWGLWLVASERAKKSAGPDWSAPAYPPEPQAGAADLVEPLPEAARPRPQQPPSRAHAGCMILFSLAWTGFSLLFVILPIGVFIRDWYEYTLLRDSGVSAEAVIISRRIDEDSDGDTYYITYRYTAPLPSGDSRQFTKETSVSRSRYEALPPESRVEILYAAPDPAVSQLRSEIGPPFFLLLFSGCGGLFVLVGLGLLTWAVRIIRQANALTRRGRLAAGIITDRWIDTDSDGDKTYNVAYRFRAIRPDGSDRPVLAAEYNRKVYDTRQIGDPVEVRYLPDKPETCRLES